MRRVLLLYNSPRVKKYFSLLSSSIVSPEVICRGVSFRLSTSPAPARSVEEIMDYGVRRKEARARYGPARLAFFRRAYRTAAGLHYNHVTQAIRRLRPDAVGVWGGNAVDARAVVVAARNAMLPCFRFENGFLPNTTQMDLRGVNAESSVPRDEEFYLKRAKAADPEVPYTPSVRAPLRAKRGLSPAPLPERYLFVPFQVRLDSQIILHSPWIRDMHQLFDTMVRCAQGVPGTPALVFKEHPSCPLRYPELHEKASRLDNVGFANGNSTEELIRNAAGVVTINSTVGAETLLLDKPVLALGNAVYEVPGVASSARSDDEVARWIEDVWTGRPPAAPLRNGYLRFLHDEYLVPDRHQDPGPRHIDAVKERLSAPDRFTWA